MDQETMRNLRLDRRLLHRRGWIAPGDLEKELEALPDASGKVAPPDEGSAPAERSAPRNDTGRAPSEPGSFPSGS